MIGILLIQSKRTYHKEPKGNYTNFKHEAEIVTTTPPVQLGERVEGIIDREKSSYSNLILFSTLFCQYETSANIQNTIHICYFLELR